MAVGSNLGVVTQRQLVDEGVNVGDTRGTAHPLHVGALVRNADVTRNGVGEDIPLLHHRAASPPPARGAVLSNAAVAQQQLQHRGLPRAARPHDGRHLMRRDCDRHVVQRLGRVRPVVLKRHAPELQVGRIRNLANPLPVGRLLVLLLLHLRKAFERNLRILRCLNELDELRQRRIQLSNDVLQSDHHAKRHLALDDGRGRQKRDYDILCLVDERASYLLCLPQHEPLNRDLKQPCLDTFPLPALLLLAVVELDFLHAVDELHDVALVGRSLLEAHIVQFATPTQKEQNPTDVEDAAQQEDSENR